MNIDNLLGVHRNAMHARSQRAKLLATNIANSDTPNYKARDTAFGEALQQAGWKPSAHNRIGHSRRTSSRLSATHDKHISAGSSSVGAGNINQSVMYRIPFSASLDGNTVDKDAEQARFTENAIRYQASLQFINSRIGSLIRSLRGD